MCDALAQQQLAEYKKRKIFLQKHFPIPEKVITSYNNTITLKTKINRLIND